MGKLNEDSEAFQELGGSGQPLSDEQIQEVTSHLRTSGRLPAHLFPYLFEVPSEYQLSYAAKSRKSDVLADTMAVPLQPVKSFGTEAHDGWQDKLVLGNNLQVLRRLLDEKNAGALRNSDGTDGIRLCYIDPPFATGESWESRSGRVAYSDKIKGAEFIEWLRKRLVIIAELLADDGKLVLHLDQRYSHYMKVVLDELLPGNFRNEIVIPRGVKSVQKQFEEISALSQGHYSLLLYTKSSSTKFKKLLEPSVKPGKWDTFWRGTDRKTMRYELFGTTPNSGQWRWGEERTRVAVENYFKYEKSKSKVPIEEYARRIEARTGERPDFVRQNPKKGERPQWYQYSGTSKLSTDVWSDIPARGGETGYPTEKPLLLLTRLIEWLTEPGDIVMDAFAGSGTTAVAARRSGRRWIAIDRGKYSIYTTQSRLLRDSQVDSESPAFTVYNAGLYDYEILRTLPRSEFRRFALDLFQCRDSAESLAGVEFDGFLGEDRVLVFDFGSHSAETRIGVPFVEDIEAACGKRLGSRCFIIAPALSVEPYEDYVDVGSTRYFFLRIPYSIIAELHKQSFSELRQATSEADANSLVESVGFDFIQPPHVECDYAKSAGTITMEIVEFESEAFAAPVDSGGKSDLAMVIVDRNYDGVVLDLDLVAFAEDLERDAWRLSIPVDDDAGPIAIGFVDVYGNEYRELVDLTQFVPSNRTRKPSRKRKNANRTAT